MQSLRARSAHVAPALARTPHRPYIPRLRRPAFAGSDALMCRATMRGEASKAPDSESDAIPPCTRSPRATRRFRRHIVHRYDDRSPLLVADSAAAIEWD